jgi:hypothetical protein
MAGISSNVWNAGGEATIHSKVGERPGVVSRDFVHNVEY